MPKVTIWVKEDDYAAWKAIKNRPDWLHAILQAEAKKVVG